jgi:CBS-domain-containing membrane protein
MLLTNTIHPPAGATALLAVTNEQTAGLGWFLFPVMLLGAVLMQVAAVVVNNVQRRYPLYWWTSHPLSGPTRDLEKKESVPSHYEDSLTDVPRRLIVERGDVLVPDGVYISDEEREVLERISERI